MAKSYSDLQQQIAKLQNEAKALKQKEIAGVVARIREAIEHYGITPQEIFGAKAKRGRPAGSARKVRVPKNDRPAVKYRDENGNVWSGRGPRPGWFKAALEAGKIADEFLVRD
jgi:DNA-binding protein H-NS